MPWTDDHNGGSCQELPYPLAVNRPATTGRLGIRSKAPLITRTAAILCRSISMAGLHAGDGGRIRGE